MYTNNKQWDYL